MERAQKLLYQWLIERGRVRYERIKDICEYLNILCDLGLQKPINNIFYPLLYSGIVEFIGDSRYHITPTCAISNNKRTITVNPLLPETLERTSYIGLYRGECECTNSYQFNLNSILAAFPSIEQYIHSLQSTFSWRTSDFTNNIGVVQKRDDSLNQYFIEGKKCYSIPHQSVNPDAINIAYCYGRIMNGNGEYDAITKILRLKKFRIPIMIYRVLLVETLLNGSEVSIENEYYVFNHIDRKSYIELSRIFCKSIKRL